MFSDVFWSMHYYIVTIVCNNIIETRDEMNSLARMSKYILYKLERSRASPCAKLATHGRCSCGFLEPLTHVLAVSYPRMPLLLATVYSTQRLATENQPHARALRSTRPVRQSS